MNGKKAWNISVRLLPFRSQIKAEGDISVAYVTQNFTGCACYLKANSFARHDGKRAPRSPHRLDHCSY
jgi:hypothetical protein